jgi:NitT/TauT family transport system substrate-binding protein
MKPSFLLPLVLMASLASCGRPHPAAAPSHSPLKVAAYYWPGANWVDIANDKGWFKEAKLDVTIVDTNLEYSASFKELVEGRLDAAGMTLFDMLTLNGQGADLVCVATTDQTAGADGLAARPGIDSIAALKGRRVGAGKGTYAEFILHVLMTQEGLAREDVTFVDIPGEKAAEELSKGSVDAVFTWEPILTEAVVKAKGRKLWDSSSIPGINPSVLVTHRRLVRERVGDVQKYVRVWQRGVEFIKQNPDEAYGIVARVNKKTPAEVKAFAAVVRLLDARDNTSAFSYTAGFDSLHGTVRVMNNFLLKEKAISEPLESTQLLDDQFIKALN